MTPLHHTNTSLIPRLTTHFTTILLHWHFTILVSLHYITILSLHHNMPPLLPIKPSHYHISSASYQPLSHHHTTIPYYHNTSLPYYHPKIPLYYQSAKHTTSSPYHYGTIPQYQHSNLLLVHHGTIPYGLHHTTVQSYYHTSTPSKLPLPCHLSTRQYHNTLPPLHHITGSTYYHTTMPLYHHINIHHHTTMPT